MPPLKLMISLHSNMGNIFGTSCTKCGDYLKMVPITDNSDLNCS
jgi:hypothetical protein